MGYESGKPNRNLEDFAEIASDWFWESNAQHAFTYVSERMTDVTKIPKERVLGTRRDTFAEGRKQSRKWRAHIADLHAHRPFRSFEYDLKRASDNKVLRIRIAGQPLFDNDGTFTGYCGIGSDITDEVEAFARLKETNKALAERNEQLTEMRRQLERSVDADRLTQLLNRGAFERDIEEALGVAKNKVILLHINMDRFKWVNDTLGHPTGDKVLVKVAEKLRQLASGIGSVYRVGGDEFQIVLADNANIDSARWIADSVIDTMSAPICIGAHSVSVGASIGIAFGTSEDITTRQLITNADIALSQAKHQGRGCIHELTPKLLSKIAAQRHLASEIPRAIKNQEIVPFFQPQIHAETGEVIGAEALARWRHPARGLLGPVAFLDIAAELGMLADIDNSMMQQALAFSSRAADEGLHLPSVSVNLSAGRLINPHLLRDIEACWTDRRCKLTIELLETISFDELQEDSVVIENLVKMRALGVQVEVDDFGSGRASITSLLKIEPDRVKIDRHLIQAAIRDPIKRKVVSAILDMTRVLGIEALAEGVETPEDIAVIRKLGCDLFQGYAYARPLPAEDFVDYLQKMKPAVTQQKGKQINIANRA